MADLLAWARTAWAPTLPFPYRIAREAALKTTLVSLLHLLIGLASLVPFNPISGYAPLYEYLQELVGKRLKNISIRWLFQPLKGAGGHPGDIGDQQYRAHQNKKEWQGCPNDRAHRFLEPIGGQE